MSKLKNMSTKEKYEHIWEYYRYHIIGFAFAFFIISSILIGVFGPGEPESAVDVVIMGKYYNDADKVELFESEIENIIDEGKMGKVNVTMHNVDWDSPSSMEVALNQKLMLMFKTQEIDLMIVEETKFDSYVEMVQDGVYESLEDVADLSVILEKNKDKLVKRKMGNDKEEKVYGLYAKDVKKLQGIGLSDDYVVSVPVTSDKKENAFKVIEWLYK